MTLQSLGASMNPCSMQNVASHVTRRSALFHEVILRQSCFLEDNCFQEDNCSLEDNDTCRQNTHTSMETHRAKWTLNNFISHIQGRTRTRGSAHGARAARREEGVHAAREGGFLQLGENTLSARGVAAPTSRDQPTRGGGARARETFSSSAFSSAFRAGSEYTEYSDWKVGYTFVTALALRRRGSQRQARTAAGARAAALLAAHAGDHL